MKESWLPPVIWNSARSAPPVMLKVAGLVPTVSGSVVASVTTAVEFSATVGAALEVKVGALSLRSWTLTVMVWMSNAFGTPLSVTCTCTV
jgi:hypothetical protein